MSDGANCDGANSVPEVGAYLLSSAQEEIDRHARRNTHLRERIVEVKTTKELERKEDVLDRIPRDIGPIRSRAAELLKDLVGREIHFRFAS